MRPTAGIYKILYTDSVNVIHWWRILFYLYTYIRENMTNVCIIEQICASYMNIVINLYVLVFRVPDVTSPINRSINVVYMFKDHLFSFVLMCIFFSFLVFWFLFSFFFCVKISNYHMRVHITVESPTTQIISIAHIPWILCFALLMLSSKSQQCIYTPQPNLKSVSNYVLCLSIYMLLFVALLQQQKRLHGML